MPNERYTEHRGSKHNNQQQNASQHGNQQSSRNQGQKSQNSRRQFDHKRGNQADGDRRSQGPNQYSMVETEHRYTMGRQGPSFSRIPQTDPFNQTELFQKVQEFKKSQEVSQATVSERVPGTSSGMPFQKFGQAERKPKDRIEECNKPKRMPPPPSKWLKQSNSDNKISNLEKISASGDRASGQIPRHEPSKSSTDIGVLEASMESLEMPSGLPPSASGDALNSSSQTQITGNKMQSLKPECKSVGNYLNPYSSIEEMKTKGIGKLGKKIGVLANHFSLKLSGLSEVIHYDIKFDVQEYKRPIKKSDAELLFRAFQKMKFDSTKVFCNPNSVVFDGFANVYSAKLLNFGSNASKYETSVNVIEAEGLKRMLCINISLKRVGEIPISKAIEEFERYGRSQFNVNSGYSKNGRNRSGRITSHEEYLEAVRVLNVILGMDTRLNPHNFCINNAKHFTDHNKDKIIDIGMGKYIWLGTFKSVRTGWKVHLNVDMANKPGYEKTSVIEFLGKYFRKRPEEAVDQLLQSKLNNIRDREKASSEIRGLKVRFIRPDGEKRDYRVNGLTEKSAEQLIFEADGLKTNVVDYFRKIYKCDIRYKRWPCLHVGAKEKNIWIPIEFMELHKQACPRSKKLEDIQASDMVRKTAIPPFERKRRIEDNLRDLKNCFRGDPYANAFGISVDNRLLAVQGRVLDPPELEYQPEIGNRGEQQRIVRPRDGKWDISRMKVCKFYNPKRLSYWGVLDLCNGKVQKRDWDNFYHVLTQEASRCGFIIDQEPLQAFGRMELGNADREFIKLYQNIKSRYNAKPQMILVISERKSIVYEYLKLLGDTSDSNIELPHSIPTQFILDRNLKRINAQLAHNLLLKINSKLDGTNQVISSTSPLSFIMKEPTLFIGADVTHVTPGDKIQEHPSIAAVVASVDVKSTVYKVRVSLQDGGQVFEVIKDLQRMVRELLIEFHNFNKGTKPTRIVYFRDGVSEGQFQEVCEKELTAIQRACKSLSGSYQPNITFIVAQKRHNTRLFPQNDKDGVGKMKNVPPGTVVDTEITHPTEMSYFLVSHEGIQGTSRPTKYHLLSDDSNFSPDQLQAMTYYLCYLYARCERSVSYPAPTYYAHLAAYRGRAHHNAVIEKSRCKQKHKCNDTCRKIQAQERKSLEEKLVNIQLKNYFM